jgi:EEF1A lysine methyltransferase 1
MEKMIEDQVSQDAMPGGPESGRIVAFLSTPSLYFTMPENVRERCYVLDFDKKWDSDRGFVFYDFNEPTQLPEHLLGKCDMLVIDPPFIVEDVWRKYAESASLLLRPGNDENGVPLGKLVCTTILENASLLKDILGIEPTAFQPSIPNLVYQYNLYTNYPSDIYSQANPEIPV